MVYTGVSAMYVCTWACASISVCACVFKSSGKARGVRLGPLPSVYEVKVVFFILYAQLFPPVFESMFARRIMFSSIRSKGNILGSEWKFLHSGAGCSHEGIKETGGFFAVASSWSLVWMDKCNNIFAITMDIQLFQTVKQWNLFSNHQAGS